jgi:hypothetical protein
MRLPPYGATLAKLLSQGRVPKNDVYCFCGLSAWKKATFFKKYRYCLCLPPFEDPAIYHWPVKNCAIILFETGNLDTQEIEEIAFHLLKSGAAIVRAVNYDDHVAVFRRGAA